MAGAFSVHIRMDGLERIINNPAWDGLDDNRLLERSMEKVAKYGVGVVKRGYKDKNKTPNSGLSKYIDMHRNATGGAPLFKTGHLANSVIYKKIGTKTTQGFGIMIDPAAQTVPSTSEGTPSRLDFVAASQEVGYDMEVTDKMHGFFLFLRNKYKNPPDFFIPRQGSILSVPARPVWEPASEKIKKRYQKELAEDLKNALYFSGRFPGARTGASKFLSKHRGARSEFLKSQKMSDAEVRRRIGGR